MNVLKIFAEDIGDLTVSFDEGGGGGCSERLGFVGADGPCGNSDE